LHTEADADIQCVGSGHHRRIVRVEHVGAGGSPSPVPRSSSVVQFQPLQLKSRRLMIGRL
jgi:hypothetical protein